MHRYKEQLERAYREHGWTVVGREPRAFFSRRLRPGRRAKLLAYVENLIVFPFEIMFTPRLPQATHIVDHSNALWLLLLRLRGRSIVTCHDLIAVRAALGELEEHRTRWTGRVYQWLVLAGLRRASGVISDSDATAADVKRLVPGVAVATVHPAVSAVVRQKIPDCSPFVLVVSTSGWRKRRGRAVEVWLRLREALPHDNLRLVVVGPPLTAEELGRGAYLDSEVTHREGIRDAELFGLYENTVAVLQVSRYEGFGWPIVEANSVGTPAICTDDAVFREVAGDAGIFIDEDLERVDWKAIVEAVTVPGARAAAHSNAKRFTFEAFSEGLETLATRILMVSASEDGRDLAARAAEPK